MNPARIRSTRSFTAHATGADADDDPRVALSALADGQAASLTAACVLWRGDAQARRDWHDWHLIGDVMRSDELATDAGHDAAFLAGFRERLAAEPVVLAPAPPTRGTWLMPAAAAAGFAVVAVVLFAARGVGPAIEPSVGLAANGSPSAAGLQVVRDRIGGVAALPHMMVREQGVIRDARLDEFLRAHQQARGGVAVASPAGGLRPADAADAAFHGQPNR